MKHEVRATGISRTIDYGYDFTGRLLSENETGNNISYVYDAGGNRRQKTVVASTTDTYVYDYNDIYGVYTGLLQNVRKNSVLLTKYHYDPNGNMDCKANVIDGNALNTNDNNYEYDFFNRLTEVALFEDGDPDILTDTVEYLYDGLDMKYSERDINEFEVITFRNCLYNGQRLVASFNSEIGETTYNAYGTTLFYTVSDYTRG